MKSRIYFFFAIFSFLLLSFVLFFHFHIQWLPLAGLLLGFLIRSMFTPGYLEIFSFLIPVLPACATIESKGFPPNYLLLPLFFLAGIMAGEWLAHRGQSLPPLPRLPRFYPLFLLLLGVSFFFVMLRWSNLTLSPLAFFKDTPVAPTGQRLSFGIIFPVVELALFSLSPLFYILLLRRQQDLRGVLTAFLSGQSLSIAFSLCQRLQQWRSPSPVISGLASDATAFGFLSALAILLAWYLDYRFGTLRLGAAFAFIALAGILNSTTRVGLFAVVLAIVLFYGPGRKKAISALLAAVFAATLLLSQVVFPRRDGSSLIARLETNIHEAGEAIQSNSEGQSFSGSLTARRDVLWRYAWECLREFPMTGVGTGNFVFWVMAAHRGDYFHHLTANQYLFFTSSLGLPGLAVFLLFCFALFAFKPWPEKCLLAAFMLFFLLNDYLWFSEIALLFWMVAGLGEEKRGDLPALSRSVRGLCLAGILAFICLHILEFSDLHPKNWAQANAVSYDYGLYYPESEEGRQFQWSGEKAGIYVKLDEHGRNENFRLGCGAPLSRLESKKQTVDMYWRGKFHKRVVFRDHAEYAIRIEDHRHSQGFLEFRVRPAFNLKQLGLGGETRTLGVRLFGSDFPEIQVIAPNGGESLLPGSAQDIRWQSRGNIASLKIEISYNGGRTYTLIGEPASNDGHYSWTVAGGPSMNCLIRVGGTGSAIAVSDLPFTITSPPSRSGFAFAVPQKWIDPVVGREGWYVGDFNGDGRSDIMEYAGDRSGAEVLLSDGSRFVHAGSWTDADHGADGWLVGDFNGDGRSDIMRFMSDSSANEVFLSTGSGFVGGSHWLTSDNGPDGWTVGDFNGDGRSDLLRYLPDPARSEVFLSTGAAFAGNGVWLAENNGSDGWYVGDFNGDGRSDIMRFVPGSSGAEVFMSDGTRFVPAGSWAGANPGVDGWYLGDFDGDKKCDIMRYAEWLSGSDVFLAGDAGFYHDGNWSGAGKGDADWHIGDFDGDGSSDLFRCVTDNRGVSRGEVLLSTAAGDSFGEKAGPSHKQSANGRWLEDMPREDGLLGGLEERKFIALTRKRIQDGQKISVFEIQREYEKLKGRKSRRVMVLRLLKLFGLS